MAYCIKRQKYFKNISKFPVFENQIGATASVKNLINGIKSRRKSSDKGFEPITGAECEASDDYFVRRHFDRFETIGSGAELAGHSVEYCYLYFD